MMLAGWVDWAFGRPEILQGVRYRNERDLKKPGI